MAYFSNSTEGMVLDSQCDECIHEDPEAGCPVAFIQMNYNYIQVGNTNLEQILLALVDKNGCCQMKPHIDRLRRPVPVDRVSEKQIRLMP